MFPKKLRSISINEKDRFFIYFINFKKISNKNIVVHLFVQTFYNRNLYVKNNKISIFFKFDILSLYITFKLIFVKKNVLTPLSCA